MNIEMGPDGKLFLQYPQQEWKGDETDVMQASFFAGHLMKALQKSDEEPELFDLHYLGFQASGFLGIEQAKASAPDFALAVLKKMSELVLDEISSSGNSTGL